MRSTLIALIMLSTVLMGACSSAPLSTVPASMPVIVPRPDVITFQADKSNIDKGSSTILRWAVVGADSIIIDGGIGKVPASGSAEIKPTDLATYNLTAVSQGGTIVSSVIVNVKPFVKVASTTRTASSATAPPAALKVLPKLGTYESYVFYGEAVMVGADEHYIILHNNPAAHNPTWAELKAFLQGDNTEKNSYISGKYTCGDFAETLHNNAELVGIRAGLVAIELQSDGDVIVNHSLNMFQTTDRGLVYIDDTSSSQGYFADKLVNVSVGMDYIPNSIFPQAGQSAKWPSMGKVLAFDIQQW